MAKLTLNQIRKHSIKCKEIATNHGKSWKPSNCRSLL